MKRPVIVLGGGLAGMIAAHGAREKGAEVVIVDRGSVGRGTNSALANGVFAGPTPDYGPKAYVEDTCRMGRMLNHLPTVEMMAAGAPAAFDRLRSLGVGLEQLSYCEYISRPPRPDIIPGFTLVNRVAEAVGRSGIRFLTGFYVTDLVRDRDGVRGVKGFDRKGRETTIDASAVVLAAGGAGAIYEMNDNQKNTMGQGYRLAAAAGLPLWDMEFVQFIPVVLAEPHTPRMLLFPPFPEGTKIVNGAGVDLVEKSGMAPLNYAARNRRDEISILLFMESKNGPVYVDYRDVAPEAWKVHPLVLLSGVKFDFRNRPAQILPGAHFFMGGLRVTPRGETGIPGLFACGEVTWGLHGANRRGGNALTECLVIGRAAGEAAGAYEAPDRPALEEERPNPEVSRPSSPEELREARAAVRRLAWEKTGIVRSAWGLAEALKEASELEDRLSLMHFPDFAHRAVKEDLLAASFVVKVVAAASLGRKESRGSFRRSDYPAEDNDQWLKNSRLAYHRGEKRFSLDHFAASRTP